MFGECFGFRYVGLVERGHFWKARLAVFWQHKEYTGERLRCSMRLITLMDSEPEIDFNMILATRHSVDIAIFGGEG